MAKPWPQIWPPEIGRVVAVTPHPDDELFCAALLAQASAGGARVELVCATRGQRGRMFGRRVPAGEVAAVRAVELEGSAAALGIGRVRQLGFEDGALGDEAAAAIAGALERSDADLIVSYGPDGGYGHRDHVALVELVARARAGRRWLQRAFPPGAFADTTALLQRSAPELIAAGVDTGGVAIEEVDWIVDCAPVAAARRAALAAHASQRWMLDGLPALESEQEWYREA